MSDHDDTLLELGADDQAIVMNPFSPSGSTLEMFNIDDTQNLLSPRDRDRINFRRRLVYIVMFILLVILIITVAAIIIGSTMSDNKLGKTAISLQNK